MAPRKRSASRKGWPPNLYPNRDGFKYRHPVTRKETWMGRDKARAFAAAMKLNALLAPTNDLVARVTGMDRTIADAIRVFLEDDVPQRGWGERTAHEYGIVVRRIERLIGARPLESFSVKDAAEFIRGTTTSPRGRQTLRLVLGWILACAVQEGWADDNVALLTRRFAFERQRERLTLDAYKAIWAAAPAWVRNAMDLSLLTLLRREDVVSARFGDVREGALWIVPSKTEGSTLVRLKITLTPALEALVARCRDDVASPFLVHRLPEKARPQAMKAKGRTHHTQAMPEQLTRAFAQAREDAGLDAENAPTFHEIRSLGGALLREQGWTLEQVQGLMGHASATMTQVYLAGHETPWQQVAPGLALPAIG